jgi:hypothetical protein
MSEDEVRAAFAARVNQLCDELAIPDGHGRQTALGKRFEVSPKAARKWLMGLAYPEMTTATRMCDAAGVSLLWFLQGVGPKKGEHVNADVLAVVELLDALPVDKRAAILDFIGFQVQNAGSWFTPAASARYHGAIAQLRRAGSPPAKRTGTGG